MHRQTPAQMTGKLSTNSLPRPNRSALKCGRFSPTISASSRTCRSGGRRHIRSRDAARRSRQTATTSKLEMGLDAYDRLRFRTWLRFRAAFSFCSLRSGGTTLCRPPLGAIRRCRRRPRRQRTSRSYACALVTRASVACSSRWTRAGGCSMAASTWSRRKRSRPSRRRYIGRARSLSTRSRLLRPLGLQAPPYERRVGFSTVRQSETQEWPRRHSYVTSQGRSTGGPSSRSARRARPARGRSSRLRLPRRATAAARPVRRRRRHCVPSP